MFLIFLDQVFSATSTISLTNNIDYVRLCPEEQTSYNIEYRTRGDVAIAVVEAPQNVSFSYSYPAGTSSKQMDMKAPFYRFPQGNVQITADLAKDQCVTLAHVTLPEGKQTACLNGLTVYVQDKMDYYIQETKPNTDMCIFYAPSAFRLRYIVDAHIKTDELIVYKDEMISGNHYDYFTGERTIDSVPSNHPFIFRLRTKNTAGGTFTLNGSAIETRQFNLNYYADAKVGEFVPFGNASKYYIFPIIGCLPTILLIIGWIVAYKKILNKKPVTMN